MRAEATSEAVKWESFVQLEMRKISSDGDISFRACAHLEKLLESAVRQQC